jgi:serine/threonine-protein kinase
MKHLSQTPEAPSARRQDIPHDLDLVVLRALAKEPAERYRTAAELDRDLELVARGDPVGAETATAATMVLAGAGALDATAATRVAAPLGGTTGGTYGGDERYRAYDAAPVRRRNWWPWVVAAGAILAIAVGGWFLYDKVQNQINENKPVTVQQYTGIVESKAVDLIIADGFEPKVQRTPSADQPVGIVFEQSPIEGTSLARGGIVTIKVSTGKKTVSVPDVVGKQLTDAVAALTRAGLNAKSVGVPSDKPSGTVTAQDPRSGTSLVEGASVRINYSTGPKQVAVPPVVGLDYSTALQQLQAAGFAVARTDVESTQPAGVVTSQVPSGSSTATKGSTVNLSVSNGPQTTPLPDVTGQTEADAKATLKAAGFKVKVTPQDTEVETFDGVVISQDPPGNSQQDPNTVVTLFVGKYVPPAATTPTDTTTTTTTPTTTTTTTPTTP